MHIGIEKHCESCGLVSNNFVVHKFLGLRKSPRNTNRRLDYCESYDVEASDIKGL